MGLFGNIFGGSRGGFGNTFANVGADMSSAVAGKPLPKPGGGFNWNDFGSGLMASQAFLNATPPPEHAPFPRFDLGPGPQLDFGPPIRRPQAPQPPPMWPQPYGFGSAYGNPHAPGLFGRGY